MGGTTRRPSWATRRPSCHAAPLLSAPPPFNFDRRNWLAVRATGEQAGGPEFKPRSRHFCSPSHLPLFASRFFIFSSLVFHLAHFVFRRATVDLYSSIVYASRFVPLEGCRPSRPTPRLFTLLDLYPSSDPPPSSEPTPSSDPAPRLFKREKIRPPLPRPPNRL